MGARRRATTATEGEGDPLLGVLVLDERGRVVDAPERVRQRLRRTPGLRRRLGELGRELVSARPGEWVEHALEPATRARPGLRARMFADARGGEVVVFLGALELPGRLDLRALSPREREVALHVGDGRSNAWIAGQLEIAPSTVGWHLKNVQRKSGLTSLPALREAVTQARRAASARPRRAKRSEELRPREAQAPQRSAPPRPRLERSGA